MRTRLNTTHIKKITEKAKALENLSQHTNDPDLLRTATQSLDNAVQDYLSALAES